MYKKSKVNLAESQYLKGGRQQKTVKKPQVTTSSELPTLPAALKLEEK